MRKWIALLLAMLMLLSCYGASALQLSGIQWMQMDSIPQQPKALCRIRALDNVGQAVRTNAGSYNFIAQAPDGVKDIALPRVELDESNFGHIIVVDMSAYYNKYRYMTSNTLQAIVAEYINGQPDSHRFKFLLANSSTVIDSNDSQVKRFQGYMDKESALDYAAQNIVRDEQKNSKIMSAMYLAIQQAPVVNDGEPLFKSVFALIDPDLASNDSAGNQSISEVVSLRKGSAVNYDVVISTIFREKYVNSSDGSVSKEVQQHLREGFSELRKMAENMGGYYVQVYHHKETELDLTELRQLMLSLSGTSHGFVLDLSGLAGHMKEGERLQDVRITAFCTAGDTLVSGNVDLKVDTQLLPEVEVTPTPSPTPIPGPKPEVALGEQGDTARQVMVQLHDLGYLEDPSKHITFDETCYDAYISFCKKNNILAKDPMGYIDGVYIEGYEVLMSDAALPKYTPVPTPSPTPIPGPKPVVQLGQEDAMARQAITRLQELGYLEEDTEYTAFDESCYEAYFEFCQKNSIIAKDPDGHFDGVYSQGFAELVSSKAQPKYTPTPSPSPTPIPGPRPVVAMGDKGDRTRQVLVQLADLGYLKDSGAHETFDAEGYDAYLSFCKKNGVIAKPPAAILDGVYEEGYETLMSENAQPKNTPTPTVAPTPTATPAPTIPKDGYSLGDEDDETSGGFIAAIQAELQRLNCFATESTATVGQMDQVTLDAISVYCTAFGWNNERVDGVNRTLCEEILRNGPNRSPYEPPAPGPREAALEFMMREAFEISGFSVKMWMLCSACCVLLFLIIILIIVLRSSRKAKARTEEAPQPSPSGREALSGSVSQSGNVAVPTAGQGENTTTGYSSRPISLRIEYKDKTSMLKLELTASGCLIIGRKNSSIHCDVPLDKEDIEVSRKHAALYNRNGQVFLTDLGSVNGTKLNGTLMKGEAGNENRAGGRQLRNGDVAQIGKHRITFIF